MHNNSPIKIFIGSSPSEWLPAKVLEYSIVSRTKKMLDVVRLYETNITIPQPKRKDCVPRTPFSFQRFLIPQLCAHNGRAIYLDADMLVFTDIDALWSMPMNGNQILSVKPLNLTQKPQFSVMLMDTEKLTWDIQYIVDTLDANKITYDQLMYEFAIAEKVAFDINSEWNSLENWSLDTRLLHFTDMVQQPWVSLANPLKDIWIKELSQAIANGFISLSELKNQITLKHVRPSLINEVDTLLNGIEPIPIPVLLSIDKKFNAPYRQIIPSLGRRLQHKISTYINHLRP